MSLLAPAACATVPQRRPGAAGVGLTVNVLVLLAVALVLRVWHLGNIPGVNGDEAWSGVQAMRLVQGQPIAWRTPTGNPVNVFLLGPLALLHLVFPPSFAVLRSVAVVSGLAALVANFAMCRRVFDRPTAIVSTVLLALLPVDVAYSRFAWDASQSLLAVVAVLHLPLLLLRDGERSGRWTVVAVAATIAAVWVHPTNVFAAPLLVAPLAYLRRRELLRLLRRMNVPARPGSLAVLVVVAAVLTYLAWNLLTAAAARLHGPADIGPFIANYWELLSGVTVYSYIAGLDQATGWIAWLPIVCNAMLGGIVAVAGWGWIRRLSGGVDAIDASLLVGWISMLGGFFLVAGPEAIAPHFERYGICLVAPAALVIARGLSWFLEGEPSRALRVARVLGICAWLLPATFYVGYFEFIQRTGGCSHRAFRTAAVEPKLAAYRYVMENRQDGEPLRVDTSEWWIYWPLAYLAAGDPQVHVLFDSPTPEQRRALREGDVSSGATWHVEFVGQPHELQRLERARASGQEFERHVIDDFAGRPLISVTKTTGNSHGK